MNKSKAPQRTVPSDQINVAEWNMEILSWSTSRLELYLRELVVWIIISICTFPNIYNLSLWLLIITETPVMADEFWLRDQVTSGHEVDRSRSCSRSWKLPLIFHLSFFFFFEEKNGNIFMNKNQTSDRRDDQFPLNIRFKHSRWNLFIC